MKFNPKLESYIFAINSKDRDSDMCAIMEFCTVLPIELQGFWKGIPERSYQVDIRFIDVDAMYEVLARYEQEALIYIGKKGTVYLLDLDGQNKKISMGMKQIPHQVANCTYCNTTETYWRAV